MKTEDLVEELLFLHTTHTNKSNSLQHQHPTQYPFPSRCCRMLPYRLGQNQMNCDDTFPAGQASTTTARAIHNSARAVHRTFPNIAEHLRTFSNILEHLEPSLEDLLLFSSKHFSRPYQPNSLIFSS
jgi:hypothetical protein